VQCRNHIYDNACCEQFQESYFWNNFFMQSVNDPGDRPTKIKTDLPMHHHDLSHILDNYVRGDFIQWFFAKETLQQECGKLFEKSTRPNMACMIPHNELHPNKIESLT